MKEKSRLSMEHLTEVLDNAPAAIYVSAADDWELLYINRTAKEMLLWKTPGQGTTCFQAAGLNEPCPFCKVDQMNDKELLVREFMRSTDGRIYQLSGKLINWNGRSAHIEYILDITEKKREEERLEQYFQTIIENLPSGIAVIRYEKDGAMTKEYISEGFAAMTGMNPNEAWKLCRQDATASVYHEDKEWLKAELSSHMASGTEHFESIYRLKNEAGGYIWAKTKFSIIQNNEGTGRVYAVYHDITEEKERNQLRRQYDDLIVQHSRLAGPDVLIVGRCNITRNRILEIDDHTHSGLLEHFGTVREAFFTGLSSLIVDKEERQAFRDIYLNAPAVAAFARGETELNLKCFVKLPADEKGRYVHIKVILVEAPDSGDITGILTVTDITEQVISDRILHQISVASYDYVADLDLEQDVYRILTCNEESSFTPPHRGSHTELVSTMLQTAIMSKDKERFAMAMVSAEILRRLEQEGTYTVSYSLMGEHGEIRTKNLTMSAVNLQLSRVCLVCSDITDSVRTLENALALAEEASVAKSDFLSAMSHDIRTPMNAIMGMTTLAVARLDDRDKVADCLQKISVSSKHLLSLINDVLDMSKIERANITLNHMRVYLPEIVEQLAAIIEPQAKAAGLTMEIQAEGVTHPAFYGDSLRINQILINILSNAVKFTPEGGKVEFWVEEIPTVKTSEHVRYRFTIRDTGIGMPEEFINNIFAPFARSRAAARIEGTGLGLSITKGLVDLMNGKITVESRLNHGSVFQVELEGEVAEAASEPVLAGDFSGEADENVFSGRLFLVAEDNTINSEILCELLSMYGAKSVPRTDGLQAVRTFQEDAPGTYDAILMDIQMPDMDGYDATRAIRALDRPDAKTIPIIAMTANAFAEDIQKSLDIGMSAHVAKPIDLDILRAVLRKVFER
nr:PAS domain-containing hybrid sensor histidine kinase/response regulator [uncultured Blautia sp.]